MPIYLCNHGGKQAQIASEDHAISAICGKYPLLTWWVGVVQRNGLALHRFATRGPPTCREPFSNPGVAANSISFACLQPSAHHSVQAHGAYV